jgi:hypothetical protein
MKIVPSATVAGSVWMALVVVIVVLGCLPSVVMAKKSVLVLLNNGEELANNTCSEADLAIMKPLLGDSGSNSDDDDDDDDEEEEEEDDRRRRHLRIGMNAQRQLFAASCKYKCRGFTRGQCMVTDCMGYRRDLSYDEIEARDLTWQSECPGDIARIKNDLTKIIPSVSPPCQALLKAPSSVTCYNDVVYAEIESYTLWDSTTNTVLQSNFTSGSSICSKQTINIEAVPNDCVDAVQLELKGPYAVVQKFSNVGPFTLFGHSSTNSSDLLGRRLPVGKYTIYPTLLGSEMKMKSFSFTVKFCL